MEIQLSEHFNYRKLLRLTLMPILMMLFTSAYGIVDGFCISNFDGGDAFAGVNLIYPTVMLIGGVGFMFSTGGSALTAKRLGEGNREKANQTFTNVIVFAIIIGVILSLIGVLLIEPIANAMGKITNGTSQGMIDEAIKYGRILMIGQVAFILQNTFQNFFMVDEKPKLCFIFTFAAGITNIILDFLFIGLLDWGVEGAAIATIIGYCVGGFGPVIYFLTHKNGTISFSKCKADFRALLKTCTNGVSEFVNNIATSIVGIVFNIQLLKYYGQVGVEAYGIIMYVLLLFISIFIGYCIGVGPVISYNLGAQNKKEMHNVLSKSMNIIMVSSILMMLLGGALAKPIALMFSHGDQDLINLTVKAMSLTSFTFLFCGFSMFASSFFTALNNGVISAIVSFLRTLVFQIAFVFIFPAIFGQEGIWWSSIGAEIISMVLSFIFMVSNRKRYGY